MLAPFLAVHALVLCAPIRLQDDPPPAPPPQCIRYFSLEEIKPDLLRKAVVELGTLDAPARIVSGPSTATCRPKLSFIALEVRDSVTGKDVARALKKSCRNVDELVWTRFEGVGRPLPSIMSVSPQDCVIGMASDMRWFETAGDAKHFYFVPGKLNAESIAKQFNNLFSPFNAGDIGTLASETFTFALPGTVDLAAVKRAAKAIGKVDGVRSVEIVASSLVVETQFDGLHASAGSAGDDTQPEPRFHAQPLLDALAKEKLALRSK